jgi:hypothetical protein
MERRREIIGEEKCQEKYISEVNIDKKREREEEISLAAVEHEREGKAKVSGIFFYLTSHEHEVVLFIKAVLAVRDEGKY